MKIQLSEHFTYKKLLRFVFPSIVMMMFTSIYGVVDGLFVSNYVGKTAFAAVNLIMPFIMMLGALGFMIGTGGSAIVAKTLGEKRKEAANRYFFHACLSDNHRRYRPFSYWIHLRSSDCYFVGSRGRNGRPSFQTKIIGKACTNGSSELMTNVSMSLVNILYNYQLMRFAGENGVAAYGVIMYTNLIFISAYLGYSIGSAPIVGYHYGAQNFEELKNLFGKSLRLVGTWGVILLAAALMLARPLSRIFVGYDDVLWDLTSHGFRLYSLSFLICGFNIYGSAFFTALNNGLISAVISFLRTLVFQLSVVLALPVFLGIDGIWLAIVVAEVLALCVTVVFFVKKRKVYHYF